MSDPPGVARLRPHEREHALDVVVDAFRADPQVRFWFPDEDGYARCARTFFATLLDLRTDGGEVWVADGGDAVSMWTPPGGNLLGSAAVDSRYQAMRDRLPADSVERLDLVDEAVERLMPAGPHWYLGVLATVAQRRRQGLGAAVLAPVLANADRTGLPVALETSVPANVAFYRGFGFAPAGEIDLRGGPRVLVLHRPADAGRR